MERTVRFILSLFVSLLPACTFAQIKQSNIRQQRLLLNLSWNFLYVVAQNQIDKDSALSLSSRQEHIDKLTLITQNNELPFYGSQPFANSKEELQFLKLKLLQCSGNENTRLSNAIGWMYTFSQGNLKTNLDSAKWFLDKAKFQAAKLRDDKGMDENLCYLGLYYYKKGALQSGDSCFQEAISRFKQSSNKNGEALALGYKAVYYPFGLCPFGVRIGYLKKSLELYQQLNDKEAQAITLLNMAYYSFANNQLAECKELALASLQIQRANEFPYTHYTTDLLALIAIVEGNNANCLKYALESIRTVEATNDPVGRAYFYARAADAYGEMDNKVLESVNWYLKSFTEFQKKGGDLLMYKALYNFSGKMETLGRSKEVISLADTLKKKYPPLNVMDKQNLLLVLARAYSNIGEMETSGKYYEKAESLQPEVQAVSGYVNTSYIYYFIGLYYFKIKQYEKSRTYFSKILNTKPPPVGLVAINNINLSLFTIDSAAGHLESAIKHLKDYSRLNDSIYSEKQSKQIQEWDILYNTEKKEKNLLLLTKENQVKELSLKKADFTRNVIIASAMLLLAFLFTGYSLKQRHNKKLQLQQNEINEQNQLLKEYLTAQQKLVEEKEWLVKEIHHRVKNNLQMIISLLNAQSEFLDHPSALNAIKESRERMQAVALIHQKLYQPNQGTSINMLAYIQEMVSYLGGSFADLERINFKLDVEDINLDVSQAVPLGLILNEAITNAVKYAFPSHEHGTVNILLRYSSEENILLRIKDSGQGLPANFDFSSNNSLGIQLIQLFSEQLEGKLVFKSEEGVEISLTFKQFYPENKNVPLINIE